MVTLTIAPTGTATSYPFPEDGEPRGTWAKAATDAIVALSQACLQKSGGAFTLTADANFGASYGLIAPYYKGGGTVSSAGLVRGAKGASIGWRNELDTGDVLMIKNASDRIGVGSETFAYLTDITSTSKALGEVFEMDDYIAASSTFPAYWLGNDTSIISTANWSTDFISYLRAKTLKYGTVTGNITVNKVTGGTGTATLEYDAAAEEHLLASKLYFAFQTHGASKITITVPAGSTKVTAGTWYITAIDCAAKTITIAGSWTTVGSETGLTLQCICYPNRVSDAEATPTVKARLFKNTTGSRLSYTHGKTYNGVDLTVTTTSGSIEAATFVPYVEANGTFWLQFNISVGNAPGSPDITIPGCTYFSGLAYQATAASEDGTGSVTTAVVAASGTVISIRGSGGVRAVSGTVQLESIPSWMTTGVNPWLIDAGYSSKNLYIFGKSYT